jgi:HD-GYP domain-containing protein (c-di-GMP phosphodiesterase class II)
MTSEPASDAAARLEAAERQLLVFASDLSELYAAEKARSRDLDVALRAMRDAYVSTARALALIVEGADPDTRTHLDRTKAWACALARRMDVPHLDELELGFLLHDIGKWSVPREILLKPGALTAEEWVLMRTHPAAGAHMISDVPFLARAAEVVRSHHERWDGEGYPYGLARTEIPIGARVFALADVFDALTSDRPYRAALDPGAALEIIGQGRETHFDPAVTDCFLAMVAEAA